MGVCSQSESLLHIYQENNLNCQIEEFFCRDQIPPFWLKVGHSAARITKTVGTKRKEERGECDLSLYNIHNFGGKPNKASKKTPNPTLQQKYAGSTQSNIVGR